MTLFSVITSVYKNDNPDFVRTALDSITIQQTLKPSEVVLVVDGPVKDELESVLKDYEEKDSFKMIWLPENKGLGNALRVGLTAASYELVARMDSDDIALPDRFEKQMKFMESHPETSIVGGQITEFIGSPDNVVGKRVVPLDNNSIYHFMKSRCALNHMTVMFRKKDVIKAGNYQDWFWNEDYYLWVRMMKNKCRFANLPDVLVNVRSGKDQYSRRGGRKYFESEIGIKRLMLQYGMISHIDFFINYIERFVVQLVLPNKVRGWVYRTFARK